MSALLGPRTSNFQIVSYEEVRVDGVAPPRKLQNILGDNWPAPPLAINHVTYCYIAPEDSDSIQQYADSIGATFREQSVRRDGSRLARLIYHGDGAHTAFAGSTLQCALVLEDVLSGKWTGYRFLHIVHAPKRIPVAKPVKNDGVKKEEDKDAKEDKGAKDVAAGAMKFSLSQ